MLLGYGGLTLPYDVPANEFMTMGGFKASTSRGNVIWTKDVLDQYGPDPLRYYLASTMPENHDTDFTYDELVRRNNDELVATYGNAVHRLLTFAQRNFEGKVPQPGALGAADEAMLAEVRQGFAAEATAIEAVHLRDGLTRRCRRARREPLSGRAGAVEAHQNRPPGRRDDGLYDDSSTQWAEGALRAVRAVLVAEAARAARFLRQRGGRGFGTLKTVPAGHALPVPTPLFTKFEPPVAPV